MENGLLQIIEDAMREKWGKDITVQRSIDDTAGVTRITVYRSAPMFAKNVTISNALLQEYDSGTLLA